MIQRLIVLLLCISYSFLLGCRNENTLPASDLTVAAAANFVKVSRPLTESFQRLNKTKIIFSFGSSGQLEQQIRQGAPFDVYLPADLSYCQSLSQDGFTAEEPKVYALGQLVVWSHTLQLSSLEELQQEGVSRIAIANPSYAPYGLAARQALQSAGLWEKVQPKLVFAESVSYAFQMAETGNVEVAFVALALVKDIERPFLVVDSRFYEPIEQCAVALKATKNLEAARAFLEFLFSTEARRILQDHGYGSPQE